MVKLTKKLLPIFLCFVFIIGSCFLTFADGGSFNFSKLYIKNGSGVYKNTTSNIITLKNYPTKVVFKRTDPSESVNISGSHITIFDSDDNEVVSFITGSEPKKLDGILTGGKTYTIKETKASYGHTPEVSELEIEVQNITDEQVFIIKDKVDDNGYWQLFNNDYSLKSSVKKETTTSEVSSGEKKVTFTNRKTNCPIINTEGYDYIKVNSVYANATIQRQLFGGFFIYQNSLPNGITPNIVSDIGIPAFKLNTEASVGSDLVTTPNINWSAISFTEPFTIDISEFSFIKIGSITSSPYNSTQFTFNYELIKTEEISSYPKGFTKSNFYFYNDLTRSVAGSVSSNGDRVVLIPDEFDDSVNSLLLSDGYSSESDLDDLESDDFSSISCTPERYFYNLNSAELVPKYENTYYKVIVNGEEFKIRLETRSTGIEVYGFQINASNSEGSASEYCPSFRTMSRSDKLQVKSDDDSDNKRLYPVENYGTIYAPGSVNDSDMSVTSDKAYHYQAHDEGFFENYNDDFCSTYYALTLKNLFYRYHNLTDKYKFRAYCELEDGTIIYSDNIVPASVKSVGEAVYDKKISYSNITHQWIYDYVIYPTSLKTNIVNITYFLLEMTDAQSKDDLEYALCNQWYKDANYWCENSFNYKKESYYERGTKFVCTSEITHNGKTYNVESALLEILNDISVTKYDTVSDWIYYNQKDYQFDGIAYQKEYINNQMIVFD